MIEAKFRMIFSIGCIAHLLDLLTEDLGGIAEIKANDVPTSWPKREATAQRNLTKQSHSNVPSTPRTNNSAIQRGHDGQMAKRATIIAEDAFPKLSKPVMKFKDTNTYGNTHSCKSAA